MVTNSIIPCHRMSRHRRRRNTLTCVLALILGVGLLPTGPAIAGDEDSVSNGIESPTPGMGWPLQAELLPPDGHDEGNTIISPVALEGDTALIGVAEVHSGPSSDGKAYVYIRDSESWNHQAVLVPDEHPLTCVLLDTGSSQCPQYGAAVALSGDVVVVGQPWSSDPLNLHWPQIPPGAAYVFVREGDQWIEQARLTASDGEEHDTFGYSVAIDGDSIVVGAPRRRAERPDRPLEPHGTAYVFVRDGDDWLEQARLDPPDYPLTCSISQGQPAPTGCPNYGHSVAIDDDTVLVSARLAMVHDDADGAGFVDVFTRDGNAWSQQTRLIASNFGPSHIFGMSVALEGDTALIGAPVAGDEENPIAGAGYIFTRSGDTWTEQQLVTPSDAEGNFFFFGWSVAVDGSTALIGAVMAEPEPANPGIRRGAAYRFTRDSSGTWNEQNKLLLPPERDCPGSCLFGRSVALSNGIALVSASTVPVDEDLHGAAYVFVDPVIFRDEFEEL